MIESDLIDSYQQAQDTLKLLQDCALALSVTLPLPHRVSVADQPVIACAETRVAVTAVQLQTHPVNTLACDVLPVYTLAVTIARECSVTWDESTGAEVTSSLDSVSQITSRDQQVLYELFDSLAHDPVLTPGAALSSRLGGIVSTLTAGLAITTLTAVIG